ncbi:MAG: PAS domain S-box-containing protein [Maricaulis maris]|jgi:PAS domain S-box-containing protein|uniref:sensor histidine kinase n=1 Tax=Maricaulis maris TaxID=74318 RepID=UPI0026EE37F3|nr:ATP-binding protein [Maricaulis maris]
MNTTPAGDSYLRTSTGDDEPKSALQRLTDTDGWVGQVLPGLVAVTCIFIVALAVMAGEGRLMSSARETNLRTLETVLRNTRQRFELWAQSRENDARVWAENGRVQAALEELASLPVPAALAASPQQEWMRDTVGPWLTEYGYRGFTLMAPNGSTLASMRDDDLGQPSLVLDLVNASRLASAGVVLTRPHIVDVIDSTDSAARAVDEEILMYAVATVRDGDELLGYLALRIDPLSEYTATFRVGRTGVSGETFAIDSEGRLLTETRYGEELVEADLLVAGHPSILHVEIRDPGVDVTMGGIPARPYADWPLTEAALGVTTEGQGHNLQGYRDMRGVLVMGAWDWDPARDIGIITEVELGEAMAGANQARAVLRVFAVAMALSFILLAVLFSAHRSITRRRALATHEANQRLSQILMTAAEGIYGIDGDGVVTFINPRACSMLGYREDELIGKTMHAIVHHSRRDGSLFPREECPIHCAGVPAESLDGDVFWTKNGQPIPIESASSPIDPNDKSIGAVVTFRDVTNRKRDELALRRYAQELKRSNSELQEFAYAASHDLQEPLRKIQAFGERLNNKCYDALDETGRHYLERMVDASTRMRRLIDDLLSYSRVNSKTTNFLAVDLSAVVADVLSDLEPRINAEEAKIRVSDLPAIEADPGQMHQLFLNLLANALKFRRPGVRPSISIEGSVEVGENGAMARIAVADNGVGFEPRHAERIFGMFERLHGRDEFDGTGVGLATCRKIAERHAGELTAWGEPDAGAVFTLLLPVRQGSAM